MFRSFSFWRARLRNSNGIELRLAAMPADDVDRGFEEIGVHHARNFDRVLECQENSLACPLLRLHRRQVAAPIEDRARA